MDHPDNDPWDFKSETPPAVDIFGNPARPACPAASKRMIHMPVKTRPVITRESVKVLQECMDLQIRKSQDYQNPNSNVLQAMHYRRGVDSIHDTMHGKMLRAQSLLESESDAHFESLEDTYKDLINYASFAISYIRGKMEGQDPNRDFLNRPKKVK